MKRPTGGTLDWLIGRQKGIGRNRLGKLDKQSTSSNWRARQNLVCVGQWKHCSFWVPISDSAMPDHRTLYTANIASPGQLLEMAHVFVLHISTRPCAGRCGKHVEKIIWYALMMLAQFGMQKLRYVFSMIFVQEPWLSHCRDCESMEG